MAITNQKKQLKRSNRKATQSAISPFIMAGIAILIISLLAYGMAQLLDTSSHQAVVSSALKGYTAASSEVNTNSHSNQESVGDSPIDVADAETKYLGPPTDMAGLSLAEAGQAGQPVLVWFHADW